MTPDDFNSSIADHTQLIGAAHYFNDLSKQAADGLGLDLFRWYMCGRGGVLGVVASPIVHAAFGYFDPVVVDKIWTSGAQRCDVTVAAAAHMDVSYELGRNALGGVDGLAEAARSLAAVAEAVDASGLPLFAGFRALDHPSDPADAFMHQMVVYRELRGSVHLAAIAATGCETRKAHQIKRPNDGEMFGWKETIEISNADRTAYETACSLTTDAMRTHVSSISAADRAQVATTVSAAAGAFGI